MACSKPVGSDLMPGFCGCEVAEELACSSVRRSAGGGYVEIPSLALHIHRFLTNSIEAQVLNQPNRPSREKVRHMLATQRHDKPRRSSECAGEAASS